MGKDLSTGHQDVFLAIVEKSSGKMVTTRGLPRLFRGWKGIAQLLGKGIKESKETATHKVIPVAVTEVTADD